MRTHRAVIGRPLPEIRHARACLAALLTAVIAGLAGIAVTGLTSVSASGSASSVNLYLSAPGVEGPSLTGATIESFSAYDSVSAGSPTLVSSPAPLAIGTISAGSMKAASGGVGASSTTANAVPFGSGVGSGFGFLDANGSATVTLSAPANYFGFFWIAGDATNSFVLRSGGREIATFSTRDVISLVPKTAGTVTANGGGTYTKTDYYGSRFQSPPITCGTCGEPYAFIHAVVPPGVTFDEIQFRQGAGGGFEFDNFTVANYTGSFDFTGLVGVPMDQVADDSFTVPVGSVLNDSVATNDTILAGSTFSRVTTPSLGSVTVASNGSFSFTAGSTPGTTSFTYKVCRPSPSTTCVTATATVVIGGLTVTYDAQGGSSVSPGLTTTGGSIGSAPGTPTRNGYTFKGWFTAASGGTALTFPYVHGQSADFTLYAQWVADQTPAAAVVTTTTTAATTATTAVTTTTAAATIAPTETARAEGLPSTGTMSGPVTWLSGLVLVLGWALLAARRRFTARL